MKSKQLISAGFGDFQSVSSGGREASIDLDWDHEPGKPSSFLLNSLRYCVTLFIGNHRGWKYKYRIISWNIHFYLNCITSTEISPWDCNRYRIHVWCSSKNGRFFDFSNVLNRIIYAKLWSDWKELFVYL